MIQLADRSTAARAKRTLVGTRATPIREWLALGLTAGGVLALGIGAVVSYVLAVAHSEIKDAEQHLGDRVATLERSFGDRVALLNERIIVLETRESRSAIDEHILRFRAAPPRDL